MLRRHWMPKTTNRQVRKQIFCERGREFAMAEERGGAPLPDREVTGFEGTAEDHHVMPAAEHCGHGDQALDWSQDESLAVFGIIAEQLMGNRRTVDVLRNGSSNGAAGRFRWSAVACGGGDVTVPFWQR